MCERSEDGVRDPALLLCACWGGYGDQEMVESAGSGGP